MPPPGPITVTRHLGSFMSRLTSVRSCGSDQVTPLSSLQRTIDLAVVRAGASGVRVAFRLAAQVEHPHSTGLAIDHGGRIGRRPQLARILDHAAWATRSGPGPCCVAGPDRCPACHSPGRPGCISGPPQTPATIHPVRSRSPECGRQSTLRCRTQRHRRGSAADLRQRRSQPESTRATRVAARSDIFHSLRKHRWNGGRARIARYASSHLE